MKAMTLSWKTPTRAGTPSSRSADYWLPDNVEVLVLIGDGDISAYGNDLNNRLFGNDGDNLLDGFEGADFMRGEGGDDAYVVDDEYDVVYEEDGDGSDTVFSTVSYTLPDHVENIYLIGDGDLDATGNDTGNFMVGNFNRNVLRGGYGNDMLDGNRDGEADVLIGGGDHDVYVVDESIEIIVEEDDGGIDVVVASVDYALSANVEVLLQEGKGHINALGNDAANWLRGNSGNNRLDGGRGADWMEGHGGDDTYVVDDIDDKVNEGAGLFDDARDSGDGVDTVEAWISFSLEKVRPGFGFGGVVGGDVENLTLMGRAHIDATGNDLANVLTGNAGNNRLDGGKGADTMKGGRGNDSYVVDNAEDVVDERDGDGFDTVLAAISYSLKTSDSGVTSSLGQVEDLTLTGRGNIDGCGNVHDNVITGNAGNNRLEGLGGEDTLFGGDGNDRLIGGGGRDVMKGGKGNDVYDVDTHGDIVDETDGDGHDTVRSSETFSLTYFKEWGRPQAIFGEIEDLVLTGKANINGFGNDLDNRLTGNDGNNLLNGGLGRDMLIGGGGKDTFFFSSKIDGVNVDTILDLKVGEDQIWLDKTHFTAFRNSHTLTESEFLSFTRGGATTADQRILYNANTGKLYYDEDGKGGKEAVLFAQLAKNLDLHASDIFVL